MLHTQMASMGDVVKNDMQASAPHAGYLAFCTALSAVAEHTPAAHAPFHDMTGSLSCCTLHKTATARAELRWLSHGDAERLALVGIAVGCGHAPLRGLRRHTLPSAALMSSH